MNLLLYPLVLVVLLCGVALADDSAALRHLDDADESLGEAEQYLQELAASDPEIAKLLRESRRKARADTDRSRGPAAIEGTLRATAGLLGFGPVVDAIAGGVATVTTAASAWAIGNRRRRRREEEEEDPDTRPRPASRFRQRGVPDGGEGRGEVRREARTDSPVAGNGNGYGHAPAGHAGHAGHGYDRSNRSGEYDALPATASQRAKAVQS